MIDPAEAKKNTEHLRLLSIFHYIYGGLSLVGIGFILFHFFIMKMVLTDPQIQNAKGGPPPEAILKIFVIVYIIIAFILVISCALNLLSGVFLKGRKHRTFSLIIAGLDCLQIPFGTALGVFTIIVLTRESVRQMYDLTDRERTSISNAPQRPL